MSWPRGWFAQLLRRDEGTIVLEYGMAALAVSACSAAGLGMAESLNGFLF